MVAAAPKRGDQLTLWDDEYDEASGTTAAATQPAPVPRRRPKRSRAAQLTLDTIDLSLPDPEAWLEARGGLNVPQAAVDALGEQFRVDMERVRSSTGRVFEDKDGWHTLAAWCRKNEDGIWRAAHRVHAKCPWIEPDDAFGDLGVMLVGFAKWCRPSGGAKMLTVLWRFGVGKLVQPDTHLRPGQFGEEWQETELPAREFRTAFEASDELRLALSKMTAQERKAVRLVLIEGVPLSQCASRLGLRRARGVERLIQSAFERARAALAEGGGDDQ